MTFDEPDKVPAVWQPGDVILDRYEVKEVFTGGGMGLVYRIHHLDWNIDLAVKSPRPEFFQSQQQIENFEREAETWVNLGLHAHTVSCYYVRRLGGIPGIFAEFVDGGSLADWIRTRKIYTGTQDEVLGRILSIAIQFAWGLDAAHQAGIVHQDVKPANVLMTADARAKVTDFGLAKARSLTAEDSAAIRHEKNILVTSGGLTPAYCSPEQAARQRLSHKTDLWSWGVSVFEMFFGEPPCQHGGQTAPHVLKGYLESTEDTSDAILMPQSVADLLFACFEKNPDSRPESALVLAEHLTTLCETLLHKEFSLPLPNKIEPPGGALNNRALSLLEIGKEPEGKRLLRSALEDHPESVELAYNSALSDLREGRISTIEAFKRIRFVYDNFPRRWQASYALGLMCLEQLDLKNARGWLERAREIETRREITEAIQNAEALSARAKRVVYEIPLEELLSFIDKKDLADRFQGLSVCDASGQAVANVDFSTVVLFDLLSHVVSHQFSLRNTCLRVKLSPRDDLLAAIVYDGNRTTLEIYSVKLQIMLHELAATTEDGDAELNNHLIFSPSGTAVIWAFGKTIQVWEPYQKRLILKHEDSASVVGIAVAPSGEFFISVSEDGAIRLWDLRTRAVHERHIDAGALPKSIAIAGDGRSMVIVSREKKDEDNAVFETWDLNPLRVRHALQVRHIFACSLSLSGNGKYAQCDGALVCLGSGRTLMSSYGASLHQIRGKDLLLEYSCHSGIRLSDISSFVTSDKIFVVPNMLAMVTTADDVSRYDKQYSEHYDYVLADMMFHIARRKKIDDGFAKTHTNNVVRALEVPGYERDEIASNRLQFFAQMAPHRKLWRAWPHCVLKGHTAPVTAIALSFDRPFALSASDDETLRLWDIRSATCERVFLGHKRRVVDVCLSANGLTAASASDDGTVRIWDVSEGECVSICSGHTGVVTSVRLTSDGQHAVSAAYDGTIRTWETLSGKCLSVISVNGDPCERLVDCVDIDNQGTIALCVTQSLRKIVQVRSLSSGKLLGELAGHTRTPRYGRISSDGHLAITSGFDDTLRIWDLKTFGCSRIIEERCRRAVLSHDGDWIFSTGWHDCIGVFRVKTGARWKTIRHPLRRSGDTICVSKDGSLLASASDEMILCLDLVWIPEWEQSENTN